jgi:hypothetical protein
MDYGLHSVVAGAGGALVGYWVVDRCPGPSETAAAGLAGAVHGGLVYIAGVALGLDPYDASVAALLAGGWLAIAPAAAVQLESRPGRPTPAGRSLASALIKATAAPASTAVGVLLGTLMVAGMRLLRGRGRIGFKEGVLTFQAAAGDAPLDFKAVAFGATVIFGRGDDGHPLFVHERFHGRQYSAMGDGLAPVWLTFGALWGAATAAVSGRMSVLRGLMASDGRVGNPIERGAVRFERDCQFEV